MFAGAWTPWGADAGDDDDDDDAGDDDYTKQQNGSVFMRDCRKCGWKNAFLRKGACVNPGCVRCSCFVSKP